MRNRDVMIKYSIFNFLNENSINVYSKTLTTTSFMNTQQNVPNSYLSLRLTNSAKVCGKYNLITSKLSINQGFLQLLKENRNVKMALLNIFPKKKKLA